MSGACQSDGFTFSSLGAFSLKIAINFERTELRFGNLLPTFTLNRRQVDVSAQWYAPATMAVLRVRPRAFGIVALRLTAPSPPRCLDPASIANFHRVLGDSSLVFERPCQPPYRPRFCMYREQKFRPSTFEARKLTRVEFRRPFSLSTSRHVEVLRLRGDSAPRLPRHIR